jgi:alpha-beta hydrolase superfamily lysophospholipase
MVDRAEGVDAPGGHRALVGRGALATYALIPGGGGDPWVWHRLVSELASRGQEAIAVRLPAEDDTAGWSEYADAVIDAIGDRDDVILVAASMGGFTAPIVCTRRRVDLLVLLNAMIPVPGETFNAWGSNTGSGPARAEYHTSLGLSPVEAEDGAVVYYHDLAPDLRAVAQARTWQDQSMTPLDQPWPLATWPDVPTRVLAGRTIGCSRSTSNAGSPASGSPSRSRRSTAVTWSR